MANYRRDYTPGASYFFTLTLKDRKATYLTTYINSLAKAFRHIRAKSNFITLAIVGLPDYLHFLWQMLGNKPYQNRQMLTDKFQNEPCKLSLQKLY